MPLTIDKVNNAYNKPSGLSFMKAEASYSIDLSRIEVGHRIDGFFSPGGASHGHARTAHHVT